MNKEKFNVMDYDDENFFIKNDMKSSIFIFLCNINFDFKENILLRNHIFDKDAHEIFRTTDKYFYKYFTKSLVNEILDVENYIDDNINLLISENYYSSNEIVVLKRLKHIVKITPRCFMVQNNTLNNTIIYKNIKYEEENIDWNSWKKNKLILHIVLDNSKFLIIFIYLKQNNNSNHNVYILVDYYVYDKEVNNDYSENLMDDNLRCSNNNQIYPINILSNHLRKNFIFDKNTYKQYFDMNLNITYDKLSISGVVIPIEYLLSNDKYVDNDSMIIINFKNDFIELFLRLLIYIAKISDILLIYSKETLYVICINYDNVVFTISNKNMDNKYLYNGNNFLFDKQTNVLQRLDLPNSIYIDGKYIYFLENPFLFDEINTIDTIDTIDTINNGNKLLEQTIKSNLRGEFINNYSNEYLDINSVSTHKMRLYIIYAFYFCNLHLI